MKTLAALTLACSFTSCALGGVDWVDYGDNPEENPKYLEDMMAAGTPGAAHKSLAAAVGTFSVEGKMWNSPGSESMPMQATAKTVAVLGGRYIVEEFKSSFMGQPFEGRLTRGYDNVTKRYWSHWCDSMSTGYSLSHGTETKPGTIELVGTTYDILTPKGRTARMSTHVTGDGTYTMKMFDTRQGGGEFQVMELNYTRK